ncbi:MAG: DUF5668 domain-containing protein [Anaerolineaceae bacterium]
MNDHNHDYEPRHRRSFFFPILLIAAGLIFLLSNMGYLEGSGMDFILRLWPLIFIIGGLDDLLRGESISGPVLGIGIGSLLLFANFGYFQWSVWEVLFRFWPIFLIAWGLDLIIGHRTTIQKIIGVLVALAIVAGMFWMVGVQPNFTAATNSTKITQTLGAIKTAEIDIERPVGGIRISGGSSQDQLIYGTVPADGFERIETDYEIKGSRGVYELQSHGEARGPIVIGPNQNGWNLALNTGIPVDLSVNTAVGETRLDLEKNQLDKMDVKMAVGRIEVRLPHDQEIAGNIVGAVGEIIIYVPRGTQVRINANTAVTALTFPPEFQRDGSIITNSESGGSSTSIKLKVDLPVGVIAIRYLP